MRLYRIKYGNWYTGFNHNDIFSIITSDHTWTNIGDVINHRTGILHVVILSNIIDISEKITFVDIWEMKRTGKFPTQKEE